MKKLRKQFDLLNKKKLIFFDNAASTLKPKSVCKAVDFYNRFESVNVGRGIYKLAFQVTEKVEGVRSQVEKFLHAKDYDIVFVKNTSEAINMVNLCHVKNLLKKGDEIIISDLEHNSNYLPWLDSANKVGAKLRIFKAGSSGKILFKDFLKVVSEKTKFVALTYASNTWGTVAQMQKIAEYCNERGIQILVDGSQIVAHKKVNLNKLKPSFFAFSGYKMFAPTGIGVLAIKKDLAEQITPTSFGGGAVLEVKNQSIITRPSPHKFEVGTLNISGIIGLGEAIKFISNFGFEKVEKIEKKLKNYFLESVSEIEGFNLINKKPQLPIFIFNLDGLHAHDVATFYDEFGIMVRAGNHCSLLAGSSMKEPASVRVSLSFINTKKEIDKFADITKRLIEYFNEE